MPEECLRGFLVVELGMSIFFPFDKYHGTVLFS